MSTQTFHIVTADDGRWAVKEEGEDTPIQTYDGKRLAVIDGFRRAADCEGTVMVHREDGSFQIAYQPDHSFPVPTFLYD